MSWLFELVFEWYLCCISVWCSYWLCLRIVAAGVLIVLVWWAFYFVYYVCCLIALFGGCFVELV